MFTQNSLWVSFPPFRTQLSEPESVLGFNLWWNSRARRQRAHHLHSAAPLTTSEGNSWERAVLAQGALEEGEKIWCYLAQKNHAIAWIYEFREAQVRSKNGNDTVCNLLYDKMVEDEMICYLPQGLPNIYSLSLRPSAFPMYLCPPPSPSPLPSSLCLRTPTVAQHSTKLSGSGCQKGIFSPHRLLLTNLFSMSQQVQQCVKAGVSDFKLHSFSTPWSVELSDFRPCSSEFGDALGSHDNA